MKKLSCFWNSHDWPSFDRQDGGLFELCKSKGFTLTVLPAIDRAGKIKEQILYTALKESIYESA